MSIQWFRTIKIGMQNPRFYTWYHDKKENFNLTKWHHINTVHLKVTVQVIYSNVKV